MSNAEERSPKPDIPNQPIVLILVVLPPETGEDENDTGDETMITNKKRIPAPGKKSKRLQAKKYIRIDPHGAADCYIQYKRCPYCGRPVNRCPHFGFNQ